MKVLHIDFTGTFNEDMAYQENLIPKYNAKDGHDVVFLTTCYEWDNNGIMRFTPPVDKIMNNGVRLIRRNYRRILTWSITERIRKIDGVYKLLTRLSPDIIFLHCLQTIESLVVVRYKKNFPDVYLIVDNHTDNINSVPNWISRYLMHGILWKYCAKRLEPYTARFFGVTPLRCDFLRDVYNISGDKIELLVMGADADKIDFTNRDHIRHRIRNILGISETDFVIVTGGKIDELKNIHLLMHAVIELTAGNVRLIIFGSPDAKMRPIIDDLSKSERIRNVGWIESDKVYDFFLASDLAVFPGTHSVLWEQSVGTGIPGIFKYWGGMDHVDLGGNCRFLYSDSTTEIKNVLEEIIHDKTKYQNMKRIAEEAGIEKFSYEEISRRSILIVT